MRSDMLQWQVVPSGYLLDTTGNMLGTFGYTFPDMEPVIDRLAREKGELASQPRGCEVPDSANEPADNAV
jgi:hypothetical protein